MDINWYPGHMTKAIRMIEENLKLVDVIIYVLDSRAPKSCINPDFNRMIGALPIIYALNKSDLVPRSEIDEWLTYLSSENSVAVSVDSRSSKNANIIVNLIKKMCGKKLEKYKNKGVNTTLKAMVLGIPNCGKSTLINNMCGSAKTLTGNKPGVTRGKQWVRINDYLEVLDTPGTLYPKLSNQDIARHLSYLGSIKEIVFDSYELAGQLIIELNDISENILNNRYKVKYDGDILSTMKNIALSRGFILKGNEVDYERTSTAVLDDFRKGRMGKITLERIKNDNDNAKTI